MYVKLLESSQHVRVVCQNQNQKLFIAIHVNMLGIWFGTVECRTDRCKTQHSTTPLFHLSVSCWQKWRCSIVLHMQLPNMCSESIWCSSVGLRTVFSLIDLRQLKKLSPSIHCFWMCQKIFLWLCCSSSSVVLWLECPPWVWEVRVQSLVGSYQRLEKWEPVPPC